MYLLEALVSVKQQFPDIKALLRGWANPTKMPGGQTYQQELEKFSDQHGLVDNVVFGGPRADAPEVFAAADIVVVPSEFEEPFGLVVIEAMATGKPVIGTVSGGIPEILVNGAGVLVPRGSPKELAEAIIRLLKQPALREKLGQCARKRAEEEFNECSLAKNMEKIYRTVLNGTSRAIEITDVQYRS